MPYSAPSILFDNLLLIFYILWSAAKFFFYVLPITDLIRIKNYAGRRADIAITYVTLIPVLEFVAYYYVVTRIVEKVLDNERGRRISGILTCQVYGIAAGILNTILVILFANMSYSNGFQHSAQDLWAAMAMNFIIFSSWLFLSYLHLRGVFITRRLLLTNRSRVRA
jgi:uncharacterized membrane protein